MAAGAAGPAAAAAVVAAALRLAVAVVAPAACRPTSRSTPVARSSPATGASRWSIRATAISCCIGLTAGRCGRRRPAAEAPGATVMQMDGNLVVYDAGGHADLGVRHQRLWRRVAHRPRRWECGDLFGGWGTVVGERDERVVGAWPRQGGALPGCPLGGHRRWAGGRRVTPHWRIAAEGRGTPAVGRVAGVLS